MKIKEPFHMPAVMPNAFAYASIFDALGVKTGYEFIILSFVTHRNSVLLRMNMGIVTGSQPVKTISFKLFKFRIIIRETRWG